MTTRTTATREGSTAAHEGPALSLNDVHSYIGQSHILNGVTFDVPRSKVTVLLGRNGVGKTSTLRSVLGLMQHSGSIRFDGAPIDQMETHDIARLGVAYVPEDRDVFHGLTVDENLRLVERRGIVPNYDRVFGLFPDLRDRRTQVVGTMSGGQQQMVSLSRALLNENKLLLIDEPTKGLAPRLVSEVVNTLELMVASTSVLLVEQNLSVARRLADHVVVLSEGRVVKRGIAADVLSDDVSIRRLLGVGNDHAEA